MSRWWGWWRPIDGKHSVASLRRDLVEVGGRLAEVIRERNWYAAQVAEKDYALDQRERALGEAQQAVHDLGERLHAAESLLDRVRAELAIEGLSEGQANARIRQVLTEGSTDG